MNSDAEKKYAQLLTALLERGRCAVAFSGGADSTLLPYAAREALGERVIALAAVSPIFSMQELFDARLLAESLRVPFRAVQVDILSHEEFVKNTPRRCYDCKHLLFTQLKAHAAESGYTTVVEGSNVDDQRDYRPGKQALLELGISSPLLEIGLTKEEIRALSRSRNLPTWNKPALACLASRIPYGRPITLELLERVERAEEVLRALGFSQVRVRDHGDVARIEVLKEDLNRIVTPEIRRSIAHALKKLGYLYVAADLEGYRTGAMNESFSAKPTYSITEGGCTRTEP